MGSMKPKKVSVGKQPVSKLNNAKPVKNSVRTHRNDSSEPSPLKVVGAVLGAVGLTILGGVGSYLYTYYEAASSIVTGVKNIGGKSWQKISSLWKLDIPLGEVVDTKNTTKSTSALPANEQTKQNLGGIGEGKSTGQTEVDLINTQSTNPEKKLMDIKLSEIDELPSQKEVAEILGVPESDILEVSGRTGQGVAELLAGIIKRVPPPHSQDRSMQAGDAGSFRALVFDFKYSPHAGVIVYARVFNGSAAKGARLRFAAAEREFTVLETGTFSPEQTVAEFTVTVGKGFTVTIEVAWAVQVAVVPTTV